MKHILSFFVATTVVLGNPTVKINTGLEPDVNEPGLCTVNGPVAGDPCIYCKCLAPAHCVAVLAECGWDQNEPEYVSQGCRPVYAPHICCPKVVCPSPSRGTPAGNGINSTDSSEPPHAAEELSSVPAVAASALNEASAAEEAASIEAAFFAEAAAEEAAEQAVRSISEHLKTSATAEPIREDFLVPAEPRKAAAVQHRAIDLLQAGPVAADGAVPTVGRSLFPAQPDTQTLESAPGAPRTPLAGDPLSEGSGAGFIDLVIDSGLLQEAGLFEGSGTGLF